MNLTEQILRVMLTMKGAFSQDRSFIEFVKIIFAVLCTSGRHSLTSFICFLKLEGKDWTSFYNFFKKKKWDPEHCFNKVVESALNKYLSKNSGAIVIALDDFRVEKTGKTIPGTSYQLDPKSPAFHPNLMWGHRYLHATIVLFKKKRGRWQAARAITARLKLCPHIKKPSKKASEEDWENYEILKKENNLSVHAAEMIRGLRRLCNELGYSDRKIVIVADGSYCNKTILQSLPENTELIARCKKNAKLCEQSTDPKKFYNPEKFTPQSIYKSDSIKEGRCQIFYGRKNRTAKFKEITSIFWQGGGQRRPLRCVALYGIKYRKKKSGYITYREPMYLLTTSLDMKISSVIQFYLYRWEIEVTHQQLKKDLRIGDPQVWNEMSVERCPKTIALANSIALLGQYLIDEEDDANYLKPPKWYKTRSRISLEYLRRRIRKEVVEDGVLNQVLGSNMSWRDIFERIAA